ncbi:DNA replication complex GINS protein PSF3 [Trachymyrmex septentrionalis]|uniref:DNA replication complex GINS protein PSF3 n=1 Tax=Trachymyrmex septentrionalis TaxID=34720 RepID=A0A195F9T0_9HYME|nr:PREDICTED: DNA replication complex GINS protein PSF3 [Trachymyrmex septentrionalis]KYN37136.1 DNA replication complex GINS protein PSF3 [Trachymyrmex septentrionalis]
MTLSYSYVPDYFSLTDILCTEERISCKIEVTLPRLGFLDLSSESEDLKPGAKLELPLWLAQPLNKVRESIVSVDIPKTYKEGYREILLADACTVVLNKWNPYYYELGMYLRKFNNRDCEMIIDSLLLTFRSRFRLIMDWAQNPVSDPMLNSLLPRLERDLFVTGRKAKVQLNEWLRKGSCTIETSQSAVNLKKRKRTDYELD